ncbi:hypothetical protein GW750_04830 [bacterium]|nr:hypothetical protein [bacterium]
MIAVFSVIDSISTTQVSLTALKIPSLHNHTHLKMILIRSSQYFFHSARTSFANTSAAYGVLCFAHLNQCIHVHHQATLFQDLSHSVTIVLFEVV